MDELKKYLQKNVNLLDDDLPSDLVWDSVKHKIDFTVKKQNKLYAISKYLLAACVIVLTGIGVLHLIQTRNQSENITLVEQLNETKKISDSQLVVEPFSDTPISIVEKAASNIVSVVFADTQTITNIITKLVNPSNNNGFAQVKNIDSQFSYVINLQKNAIHSTPVYTESPSFFNDFVSSFKQMGNDELVVKKDIEKTGFTPDLLEQLINVNQQKLNLLKLLQTEINKTNFRYRQNRNLIDTSKAFYIEI